MEYVFLRSSCTTLAVVLVVTTRNGAVRVRDEYDHPAGRCKRAPSVATRLARGLNEIDLVFTETNETLRSDDDPDDLEQPSTSDTTRAPHAGTSETLADLIDLAARRREHCGDSLDSPD